MADLRTALYKAGIATDRQRREAEAGDWLEADRQAGKARKEEADKERRLGILRKSNSPDNFRPEARKLLLQHPSLIREVINIAYQQGLQNKKDKGGGRLIANLLQLREALSRGRMSDEEASALVDKILTKN